MSVFPTCELLTRMWRFCVFFWRWGYLHCKKIDKCIQLSYQLLLLTSHSGNGLLSITNKKLLLMIFKIFVWKQCTTTAVALNFLLHFCIETLPLFLYSGWRCFFFKTKVSLLSQNIKRYLWRPRIKFCQICYIFCHSLTLLFAFLSFFGRVLLFCQDSQVTVFETFCCLTFCFPSIFQF